ncbi:SDR family oxidoreductase [Kribbella sp. NPDC051587]|uniref:SDR family oxidoreductase n=1 Tax=Kribbella sp. NPDC051587 TaxID=3364119 RepID=UPI003796A6BB
MRVLVTGASKGIGLEFVRQYASAGHHVIATCRAPCEAAELRSVANEFPRVDLAQLDVTADEDISEIAKRLRGDRLDLLVNNAGQYGYLSTSLADLDRDEWLRMFDVNCIGPARLTGALLPALRLSSRAQVVGISSVKASIERNAMGAFYAYRSSKSGLNAVLRSLAIDLQEDRISVFALSPGWVDRGSKPMTGIDLRERLARAKRWRAEFGDFSARQGLTDAVGGMIVLLERLTFADSGGFFDHLGHPLPW